MAQLPPFERITLDIRELRDYCLNSAHPRGRHKARVFRDALAIGAAQAEWLRDELLQVIGKSKAAQMGVDLYGSRWRIDVEAARQERRAVIRTIWILRPDRELRFVTCWVL